MAKPVTLGPYTIKGKDATRIRKDVRKKKLRQEAKKYPTQPGVQKYLPKSKPKKKLTGEQKLGKVITGERRLVTQKELAARTRVLRQRGSNRTPDLTKDQRKELAKLRRAARSADRHSGLEKGLSKTLKGFRVAGKTVVLGPTIAAADILTREKAAGKALVAVSEGVSAADKGLTKLEQKKLAGVPVGRVKMAGGPSLSEFHQAAKAFWYSGNAINAGIYNASRGQPEKIPSEVAKASQGKVKYSGRKVIGEKWAKKHGKLGTVLAGAEEFAAETPAAIVTGGSGSAAKQAGKQAGQTALREALEAEVKKAGVKNAKELTRDQVEAAHKVAAHKARVESAKVSAEVGNARDVHVGLDTKIPFSNRRIQKLKPVGVSKVTAKARRRLDRVEGRGSKVGRAVGKARTRANRVNLTVNPYATPREARPYVGLRAQREGIKARGGQMAADDYGHDLAAALYKYAKKNGAKTDEEVERFIVKAFDRVEKEGSKSSDPFIRELYHAHATPHAAKVARDIAKPFGGQGMVEWDYGRLAGSGAAKSGRTQVQRATEKGLRKAQREEAAASRRAAKERGKLMVMEGEHSKRKTLAGRLEGRAEKEGVSLGRKKLNRAMAATAAKVDRAAAESVGAARRELISVKTKLAQARGKRNALAAAESRQQMSGQEFAAKGRIEEAAAATKNAKRNHRILRETDEKIAALEAQEAVAKEALAVARGKKPLVPVAQKLVVREERRQGKAAVTQGKAEVVRGQRDIRGLARQNVRVRTAEARKAEATARRQEARRKSLTVGERRAAYEKLLDDIKGAPPATTIAETEKVLQSFIKRADQIGASSLVKRLERELASKRKTPPFHAPRYSKHGAHGLDETADFNRDLAAKHLLDDKSRAMRTRTSSEAFETGLYDFTPERIGFGAKAKLMDSVESDYWLKVAKVTPSEPSGTWHTIGRDGLQSFATRAKAEQAARIMNGKEIETYVTRLSDQSVEFFKRQLRVHASSREANKVGRGIQSGVGFWKQYVVSKPTTQMRNVVGDSTSAVNIAGARPFRNLRLATRAGTAYVRDRHRANNAMRFALDTAQGRFSEKQIAEKLSVPVKMGAGKTSHTRQLGDLLDEFLVNGGNASTFIKGEIQTGRRVKALDKIGDWINYREFVQRFNSYISLRAQGLTPEDAIEQSMRGHIDYGITSPLEEYLRRRIAPFIVFKGRNIARYVGMAMRKPGRIPRYQTVFDTLAELAGFDGWDDFEEKSGQIAESLPIPLGGKWASALQPPIGDPYHTGKAVLRGDGRAVGETVMQVRLLQTAFSLIGDNKLDNRPLQTIPAPLAREIQRLGMASTVRLIRKEGVDGKQHWHAHPIVNELLNVIPELGVVSRAPTANEGEAIPYLNFLTGGGFVKIEAKQGELERLRRRIDKLERRKEDIGFAESDKTKHKTELDTISDQLEKLKAQRTAIYALRGKKWAQKKLEGSGSSSGGYGSGYGGGYGGGY